ncbi:hypothetical protein LBMAG53_24750 [Planctomycetota bacterium]|nr:hypothetical protein LBMAG53_24750 [Planctomycetota bacterium]
MFITLDLPDSLVAQDRQIAADAGISVDDLIIEGLPEVIARRASLHRQQYRLADGSVTGQGLQPGIPDLRAETIRDLVNLEVVSHHPLLNPGRRLNGGQNQQS